MSDAKVTGGRSRVFDFFLVIKKKTELKKKDKSPQSKKLLDPKCWLMPWAGPISWITPIALYTKFNVGSFWINSQKNCGATWIL